ncbi:MAG: hypothetical protein ACOC8F_01590, partial [Planctomycetota bacterium]
MTPAPETPADRAARRLEAAAFGLVLACLVARAFLGELPYRTSVLQGLTAASGQQGVARAAARAEPARVTFAVLILAAGALWLAGCALRRRLRVRYGWLGVCAGVFIAVSLVAASRASDVRSALDAWVEQATLLATAVLMAQLCADRRRFAWVVVVLAALAATLAVKGLYQVAVEIPDRIAEYRADPSGAARHAGVAPGSGRAAMLRRRVMDPSPTGYFALANVFASQLLIPLAAAAGLTVAKLADALP